MHESWQPGRRISPGVSVVYLPADMEVKPINKRLSGQSFEVILKAPADLSPDRPQPLASPPKKKDISLDDLQKRLEAAEERRKVRGTKDNACVH